MGWEEAQAPGKHELTDSSWEGQGVPGQGLYHVEAGQALLARLQEIGRAMHSRFLLLGVRTCDSESFHDMTQGFNSSSARQALLPAYPNSQLVQPPLFHLAFHSRHWA